MRRLEDPIIEHPDIKRRAMTVEIKEVADDRTVLGYANTKTLDCYGEINLPDSWQLERFLKNPVLMWAHNYRLPPVGHSLWMKPDKTGLLHKSVLSQSQFGSDLYALFKEGSLRSFSVGYMGLKWVLPEDGDEYGRLMEEWDLEEGASLIGTENDLYELSTVPIPADPNALVLAVKAGVVRSQQLIDSLAEAIPSLQGAKVRTSVSVSVGTDIEKGDTMGATPFADLTTAPEDTAWDATKARRGLAKWASSDGSGDKDTIDWGKYRKGFFWYDSSDAESFGSYKLPFAYVMDGQPKAVWNGVAASMGALLGARGGVDIPDADRKPVYNHIVRYYKKFEKEPPEFKMYDLVEMARLIEEMPERLETAVKAFGERLDRMGEALRLTLMGWVEMSKRLKKEGSSGISPDELKQVLEQLPETIRGEIRRMQGKVD